MAFQSKDRVKRRWLAAFERQVIEACPQQAGRIDWDTAIFMFNRGDRSDEAAERVIARLKKALNT